MPSPSPVPAAARRDLPSLTGLRAVAAGLVFAFHVAVVEVLGGTPGAALRAVTRAGGSGVGLFFVLSGFVLAWSHDPRTRVRTFYRRRAGRIVPAHAVWVVVAVVATAAVAAIRPAGSGGWPDLANLFLVSAWVPAWWQAGNPVAWSLVCEAFFYAVFPAVWWGSSRLRSRRAWVVTVTAAFVACCTVPAGLAVFGLPSSVASHHPLTRLPEFVLGVTTAVGIRRGFWGGPRLGAAVVIALACYAAGAATTTAPAVTVLSQVGLVAALARRDLADRPTALRGRLAVRLGTWSFAFYLCHLLVLGVVAAAVTRNVDGHPRWALLPGAGLALAVLAVGLALAWATHRLVERPARDLLLR